MTALTARKITGSGSLECIQVENALCRAEVYLQGAHVTAWQPAGERPVLWVSPASAFASGKAIRGGVPICLPWFGAHPDTPSAPAHGFARTSLWTLEETRDEADGGTAVTFRLSHAEGTSPVWPGAFDARFVVTAGRELDMSLTIRNRGTSVTRIEAALHTYFAVSDIERVTVTGLAETEYLDKVEGFTRKRDGREPIRFSQETDRVYLDTVATCAIVDPGWNRRTVIAKRGSAATVVWNPWDARSRSMSDMGPDVWRGMLCVETAAVGASAIALAPGETHEIGATIALYK
jgi:glucose-6-phosphate 1-epimerase